MNNNLNDSEDKEISNRAIYSLNKEIKSLFTLSNELNNKIINTKIINPNLWNTILQKLKIDWVYHSNSLEGNSLNREDTHFFLTEGLTVEGKPLKDFLDAQNHSEAIDFLYEVIENQRDITEGLIKKLNALILHNVSSTIAKNHRGERVNKKATPGQYKTQPNHVLLPSGELHQYVDPIHVQAQMQELIKWIDTHLQEYHPILVASIAHYNLVRIHPFDDGNGRGARILMNLILMKRGFFPAVIKTEKKRGYLNALHQADNGDLSPFISFVAKELIETQERVIFDLENFN
jgi:Fic family protein